MDFGEINRETFESISEACVFPRCGLTHTNKKSPIFSMKRSGLVFFGSSSKTRTCDKVVNSHLLYQLSYRGLKKKQQALDTELCQH